MFIVVCFVFVLSCLYMVVWCFLFVLLDGCYNRSCCCVCCVLFVVVGVVAVYYCSFHICVKLFVYGCVVLPVWRTCFVVFVVDVAFG